MTPSNEQPGRARRAWRVVRQTFVEWQEDDAIRWSAAIAYYSVVSLAPLVVLAATVVGTVMEDAAAQRWVLEQVGTLAGSQAADVAATVIDQMPALDLSSVGAILTVLLLLFGATAVFANLQKALNRIWGVEARTGVVLGLLRTRATAFTTVLVFGAVMVLSVFLSSVLSWLGPLLRVLDAILPYVAVAEVLSSVIVLWLAVGAVFWVLPDVRIRWRDVWFGALVTALLLVLGKSLLSAFLARNAAASMYGAAGSIFLLLLWVYYSALVFFMGAEFTQVWANERGRAIQPTDNAVSIRLVEEEDEDDGS